MTLRFSFLRRQLVWLGLFAACVGLPAGAQSARGGAGQSIELVVLFPAASSADISARVLAEGMSKYLDQNIVVVNKPGGGGAIGYKYVASAPADGLTMVWSSNSISTNFHNGTMDIDYKAFTQVARATAEIPLVAVRAASPWKTLPELLAHARANPDRLTLGNSGVGSHTHMSAVALLDVGKVTAVHVPFGAAQVVPSLLGGHIDAVVQLPAALAAHIQSGTLRAVGALSDARSSVFPSVPTAVEQGLAMRSLDLWRGISVPYGTPRKAVDRLEKAVEFAVSRAEFIAAGQKFGFAPTFQNRQDFGLWVARDDAELAVQMKILGIYKQR